MCGTVGPYEIGGMQVAVVLPVAGNWSASMYVYISVYIYRYIYIYICTHIYIYVHI